MNYVKLKRDIQNIDNKDEAVNILLDIIEQLLDKTKELEKQVYETAQYLDEVVDNIKNGNKL